MSPEILDLLYTIDQEQVASLCARFASGLLSGLGHNPQIALREIFRQNEFFARSHPESFVDSVGLVRTRSRCRMT